MKTKINICRQESDKLIVVDEKELRADLDEKSMTLFVKYNGEKYEVLGNIYFSYIVA